MEFTIRKTSDWEFKELKTFHNLEELISWIESTEFEKVVIEKYRDNWTIEIYDDWRE